METINDTITSVQLRCVFKFSVSNQNENLEN
jgi:hypothetical protein